MENKLFYCYSKKLKGFIESNGIRFESKAVHPKSNRPYYLYIVDDKLDKVLKRWDEYKRTFEEI